MGFNIEKNAEIVERIKFYITQKGGNKSALARDWGISPSHLGVVLKGTRQLSSTMIENAGNKGYNPDWLLNGLGEPYLTKTVEAQQENAPDYFEELLEAKNLIISLLEEKIERLETLLAQQKLQSRQKNLPEERPRLEQED